MFSSKIIRGGSVEARSFPLGPVGEAQLPEEGGAFVPASYAVGLGAAPDPAGSELPVVEEVATIPEEEALQRIEAAYQEGVREGRRDAEAELASVSEALAKALMAVGKLRDELFHDAEEDLLKLSLALARAIVVRQIEEDPAVLGAIVLRAVESVSECDEVVVRLHPEDQGAVAQSREFAQLSSEKRRITLKGDAGVERGGCLVETVRGNVDARLGSQLDELYRRLVEERSARKDEPEPH